MLLQSLDLSGWFVDVRESGKAYSAFADRGNDRLAAWGLSYSAVVTLLHEQSLEAIGKEVGLTRERVRQLETQAFARLQNELAGIADELADAA